MPTRSRSGSDAALEQVLEQPRQIAPAFGLGVQPIERLRRLAIAAGDLQHPLVRRDRLVEALQRALGQRADLQPELAFGLGVGPRQLRAPDQHLVQRLAVAGLAIDALQRLQRILIVGDAIEHAPVVVRRRGRVALGQRDLGDGAIEAQLHRLVEHVGADLAVQRRDLADPLQAGQPLVACRATRASSGSDSASRIASAVVARARLLVAQPRLLQRRQPHQLLQPAARVGLRLDVDAHDRRQLGEAPAALVDRLQRLRRRQPQAAVGARAPGSVPAPPARPGPPGAASSTSRQRPSASAGSPSGPSSSAAICRSSATRFGRASARERQPALQDLQALAVAPLLLVEPRQRLQRLVVLRVLVEDADAGGDRLVDVADVALEQARDRRHSSWRAVASPAMSMRLRSISTRWRCCDAGLEDAARARRSRRAPAGSISRIDRSVATAASVSVSDFSCSSAMRNRIFLRVGARRRPAHLHREDLHQPGDVAGLGVQPLQRGRRRRGGVGVVRIEGEHQLPDVDRRAAVAEAPREQLGRARQQVGAAGDVAGVALERQLLVDVDQLREPLQRRARAARSPAARPGLPGSAASTCRQVASAAAFACSLFSCRSAMRASNAAAAGPSSTSRSTSRIAARRAQALLAS